MNIIEGIWRTLTDRKVSCPKCGQQIGYVPLLSRYKRWQHVECPPYYPVQAI